MRTAPARRTRRTASAGCPPAPWCAARTPARRPRRTPAPRRRGGRAALDSPHLVAHPGQHRPGRGRRARRAGRAASSPTRGPSRNRPSASRASRRCTSSATASRCAVARGRPVSATSSASVRGVVGDGSQDRHTLVQHADSAARLSHNAILTSQQMGCNFDGQDARREALGQPRRAQRGRRAGPALHRHAPDPRGHQPAGLRRTATEQPHGAPAGPHRRDRGPQRPDRRHRQADRRPGQPHPGRDAAQELRRVRRRALPDGRRQPGHRARHRPAARDHPAGHDDRVRRLAHLDARRVRRARVRHRHEPGRARAGHPDAADGPAEDDGGDGRRRPAARRHAEGRDPRRHRQDRHRRRPGLHGRVPRHRLRADVDGGPHDGLQHEHRMGRARRHGRARPDDLRLPEGTRARADRCRVGRRRRVLDEPAHRRRRRVRCRGPSRRGRPDAVRHVGHQPRTGRAARAPACPTRRVTRTRATAPPHAKPCSTWISARDAAARHQGRHGVRRLVHQRAHRGPARGRGGHRRAQGRRRGTHARRARLDEGARRRPRPRGSTPCSPPPAPSGARPDARCAWA